MISIGIRYIQYRYDIYIYIYILAVDAYLGGTTPDFGTVSTEYP